MDSELSKEQQNYIDISLKEKWTIPKFKAEHFVGHGQITPFGAIKQYFLELVGRETAIQNCEYEIEKLELDIDIENKKYEESDNEFEKRRCQIEIKHMKGSLNGFIRNLEHSKEERLMYLNLIEDLDKSVDGVLIDGTRLVDAILDKEKFDELERDYWIKRLGKQAAMDMIAYGKIGVGNMDSIVMLGYEDQRKTLELASDVYVCQENRLQLVIKNSDEKYRLGEKSKLVKQLHLTKE